VRFNGHYHGGNDDLMGGILGDPRNPYPVMDELENNFYSQFTNTDGRHPQAFNQVFMIEWNDLQALE
jgi:glutamate-1-semialdehyde aminotransferase